MRFICVFSLSVLAAIILWLVDANAGAEEGVPVDGVMGISPVSSSCAFAVWVPLDPETSISGFRWYNNDSSSGFSEVLAVAGEYGAPELLSEAVVVAENVHGLSHDWSEWSFSQPISSASEGLYLLLRLEEGSDYVQAGIGGGLGVGYFAGAGNNNCWISGDGIEWDPLDVCFQMAVYPVQNAEKNKQILILFPPGKEGRPEAESWEVEIESAKLESLGELVCASPNPFNPNTSIQFEMPEAGPAKVSVFDIRGMLVRTLVNEALGAGAHSIPWNGRDHSGRLLASGRYIVLVETGLWHSSTSVVLVK